ncbi:OST-HTH/LOTUS domain-containing protein [Vibrio sp. 378]|uniref:OST-HTH/LOTUS domain-containing protein n=1 Tax=Vibrio TaxID=662 RepID=UPI00111D9D1B|nr:MULTISPECIES: OST-HTH/LOTUS domain-containing protein [Vibrio]EHD0106481.1 hypothetical protein [Vibrio parahaemolyticus]MDW2146507.1 OST-HTH/LOTUS domain-containing protein [Vibrio sp. 378]TOG87958.1 hypothetical protein CGI91_18855 [Vibrio parahaemolyticus]HCE4620314.1 OST-HTH/LOTUS domain-containing protein [Vibrio parahaemolyticus]
MELEISLENVQQKIGRNVLSFQLLEHLLKTILSNQSLSGGMSGLHPAICKKKDSIKTLTLGHLVRQYTEESITTGDIDYTEFEDSDEPQFSFRFATQLTPNDYAEKCNLLSELREERNQLIHHFLPRLDPGSGETLEKLSSELDKQNQRVTTEIRFLQSTLKGLDELRRATSDYIKSEAFEKKFELIWLQQSDLVIILCEIASQISRTDGWSSLPLAGKLLKNNFRDEADGMKERYGYKSLKKLLLATEMFEVVDEQTKRGGTIQLFRRKPN